MSGRHRTARWGSERVGVSKQERLVRQRTVRHRANTELHLAALAGDTEGLVFAEPRHSGLRLPSEDTAAPSVGSHRVRHWKQPFWKRRNAVARQRAQAIRQIAA